MSGPELGGALLPPGTRVALGRGLDGEPVIEVQLPALDDDGLRRAVTIVAPPREIRGLCRMLLRQVEILEIAARGVPAGQMPVFRLVDGGAR